MVILLYMISVLLIFRTHYSIDVMMGFTCAHYIFTLVDSSRDSIDSAFSRLLHALHRRYFRQQYGLAAPQSVKD